MGELHPTEGILVDLALADVDELQRDQLTAHLAHCEPCRTLYGQLADSVDHVLAAAPRVDAPPGFVGAVLAAFGMVGDPAPSQAPDLTRAAATVDSGATAQGAGVDSQPDELASRRRPTGKVRGPRGVVLAAVAAAMAFILGATGTLLVLRGQEGTAGEVQAAAAGPALVTANGQRVGTVLDSHYDGEAVLIVTLTAGKVGKVYECQLVLGDGSRESAGTWEMHEATGATWVLEHPEMPVTAIELVTETGHTWATAQL